MTKLGVFLAKKQMRIDQLLVQRGLQLEPAARHVTRLGIVL